MRRGREGVGVEEGFGEPFKIKTYILSGGGARGGGGGKTLVR